MALSSSTQVREEALRLSEESRLAILEMEVKHAKQNQIADSRLNHLIKGTCGTARMCMDLVHSQCRAVLPPQHAILFEQATLALEQTGQWCHMRELFIALDRNEYQTALTHCRPREWLAQLVIADGYLEDGFERSGSGDGHGESTSEAQHGAQHGCRGGVRAAQDGARGDRLQGQAAASRGDQAADLSSKVAPS